MLCTTSIDSSFIVIGMEAGELESVRKFKPFYQCPGVKHEDLNQGSARGTGLGLCIANVIIQCVGGCITVDSTPGRVLRGSGCSFR